MGCILLVSIRGKCKLEMILYVFILLVDWSAEHKRNLSLSCKDYRRRIFRILPIKWDNILIICNLNITFQGFGVKK